MKTKIILYVDKIYHEEKIIDNSKKITEIIKSHVRHLGDIKVYYKQIPPKKWWKKILYYCTNGY